MLLETATKAFLADSVATVLINGSLSIQKLGHRAVENNEGDGSRAHLKSPWWWLGLTIMVTGVIIHICALPYADMTLLAANCSLAIIANLFLSIYLFNEKWITKYDLPALVFIIGGCSSIVALANKEEIKYDGQAMLDILLAYKALGFYAFVVTFMILSHVMMKRFEKALRTFETDADLFDYNVRQEVNDNPDPALLVFPNKTMSTENTQSARQIDNTDDLESR